jgi:hypothetical protein
METVVDAHIVKGYFEESVLDTQTTLSASPSLLVDRLGTEDRAFLDDSGHIAQEWRDLVQPEWFDAWYAELLLRGAATEIPTTTRPRLRKKLVQLGFPQDSQDIWYIRTASAVAGRWGAAVIVTEDMHFYSPKETGCTATRRLKILRSGSGSVATHLRRKARIHVLCLATYCELAEA